MRRLRVVVAGPGGPDLDASCLLLAADGKVRSDDDFVFYNQPGSPDGSVRHAGKSGREDALTVDLAGLAAGIETLAVAASTEGQPLDQVQGLQLRLHDGDSGTELIRFDVPPAATETALVLAELYRRRGEWKVRAVAQGWDSGLAGLATHFGITPAAYQPPAPPPPAHGPGVSTDKRIRLEKQLANQPAHVVALVKKAGVSLEKQGMAEHRARVALCLDISASMKSLYKRGKIQQLRERVLALAVQLDDDGQVDVFLFGEDAHDVGPLDLDRRVGYIEGLLRRHKLEGGTYYGRAMAMIRKHYFPYAAAGPRNSPRSDKLPVFVMFVTDGQTFDEDIARLQVTWSSYEPLFWQFMAIGQSSRNVGLPAPGGKKKQSGWFFNGLVQPNFGFLEELDNMGGRFLDNANFFSVADPMLLPDDQLFDLLMTEYPGWVRMARQRGLLPTL